MSAENTKTMKSFVTDFTFLFAVPHAVLAVTLSNLEILARIGFTVTSAVCLILVTRHKLKKRSKQ